MARAKMVTIPRSEYERLLYHEATTVGLWATDRPDLLPGVAFVEDEEGLPKAIQLLFEIKRTLSNEEMQKNNSESTYMDSMVPFCNPRSTCYLCGVCLRN